MNHQRRLKKGPLRFCTGPFQKSATDKNNHYELFLKLYLGINFRFGKIVLFAVRRYLSILSEFSSEAKWY